MRRNAVKRSETLVKLREIESIETSKSKNMTKKGATPSRSKRSERLGSNPAGDRSLLGSGSLLLVRDTDLLKIKQSRARTEIFNGTNK